MRDGRFEPCQLVRPGYASSDRGIRVLRMSKPLRASLVSSPPSPKQGKWSGNNNTEGYFKKPNKTRVNNIIIVIWSVRSKGRVICDLNSRVRLMPKATSTQRQ